MNQFIIKMKGTITLICLIFLIASSEAALRPSHFVGTSEYNQRHIRTNPNFDVC